MVSPPSSPRSSSSPANRAATPRLGPRETDRLIEELAASQHGVVTRTQLRARGVSDRAIERRVHWSLLVRLHVGIYRVGPVIDPHAREMAAALACGPGAAVSHTSAAVLWTLLEPPSRIGPVHVSVGGHVRRSRRGIRVHRSVSLCTGDVTRLGGVPVTSAARTLLDLTTIVKPRVLERAAAEALAQRHTDEASLRLLLERLPQHRGAIRLLALLEPGRNPRRTESPAEELVLALVRRYGLPDPQTNVEVCGYRVDLYWADEQLVVEIDGYGYHSDRRRFEDDRRRDADLAAAGIQVIRVTWRQLKRDTTGVMVRLAQALAQRARTVRLPQP